MPDIQLPAIRLYYEERGEGAPILGIHGTSSSALMWESSAQELAQFGRIITYDRRGCTRSQRPEPYFSTSVSGQADDAAALLVALSATPAIVIGRSYGGYVAVDLALRYPEHVRAIILLEGAIPNLSPEAWHWWQELSGHVISAANSGMDTVGEVLLREVLGDAAWEQVPDQMRRMVADNGPAILAEFQGGLPEVDAATLATLDKPVLLIAATDSPEAERQATYALAAAIPHARTVIVEGGHIVNPSEPAVLDFIQEILADSHAVTAATI